MPKLTIDGQEVEVPPGLTILQACESVGIEIPRFCYHERLSVAGNCRMCLVALQGTPKPTASCAMPAADGMVVLTNTPEVHKMRRGVVEFLLINHPLDCPICDQGGECDLQDMAMGYGFDRSRFNENKRAVKDKDLGPLIKTSMTRCIHCTRSIRFAQEVAGVPELGATGRGEKMEVGTYIEKALTSEMSGNMIDLCPVGALTSKPYAYAARPWELSKTESIDVMDALGSNIRVDVRGNEVLRVLPRINEDINEEWISDKTRFACDGLKRQRLDRPYLRRNGKLQPVSWPEALSEAAARLKGAESSRVAAIAGDLVDCESMLALKMLMQRLGSPNLDCRQDGVRLPAETRAAYLFNSSIAGIDQAGACLIIGANPRAAAPVLNARLRKRVRLGGFPIAMVGPWCDLTFDYQHLGNEARVLDDLAAGTHPFIGTLRNAARPMLILGAEAVRGSDGAAVLGRARHIADANGMIDEAGGWNGFNILHSAAARVGGLDIGFVPGSGGLDADGMLDAASRGEIEVIYLLGAVEVDITRLGKAFVIYQGHHGDAGAQRADLILPGAAYTEKSGTYVNLEGRVQHADRACYPPGEAREDWAIIRALSETLGCQLPFNNLIEVRRELAAANAVFAMPGQRQPASWMVFGGDGPLIRDRFELSQTNVYLTNPICRASVTMAKCAGILNHRSMQKTGTDD